MTEALRSYFLTVTGAALLTSVLLALVPAGTVKKAAAFVSGLVMIAAVLGPLTTLDLQAMAEAIARSQMKTATSSSGIPVHSRDLTAELIAERCAEYIEDKAVQLGASVSAEIQIEKDATYPYPKAVTLQGSWTSLQRKLLSRYIVENLAIPEEEQRWN